MEKYTKLVRDKIKSNKALIIIVIFVLFCLFWYMIRPPLVYKKCQKDVPISGSRIIRGSGNYEDDFMKCIRSKGLNK